MTYLEKFIVSAKMATYVGGGKKAASCRLRSHDLTYKEGGWSYLDSYFGGIDFLGQEVVWHSGKPLWAMNYYGYILRPDLIKADQAGGIIQEALSKMYREGRFLGGYARLVDGFQYLDSSDGNHKRFEGVEKIELNGTMVYQLKYHGGLIQE